MLILIGIVSGAVLGTLIGVDIQASRGLPGGGGFFSPWEGARAFIFEHTSPYGGAVVSLTQGQAYGRPIGSGDNPYFLSLPFFLLPVYFPFALAADPAVARGIWLFVNEVALVGTALMSLSLIEWRPGRALRLGYAFLAVFGFYSVASLVEGGPAVLLGFLYLGVLFAYATDQDELAGALLVFTLFRWEIGLMFVPFVLWKSIYDKRRRVLAGFGMMLMILLVVSFILYPGWVFPFVTVTLATVRAQFGITSHELLARLWPAYGAGAAQALTILLVILVLYEWSVTRRADMRRFIWAGCLTLAVTPLIGVRTEMTNLVVLLPSLALIFAAISSRWRSGPWLAGLLLLVALLLPWGWFVRWTWLNEMRAQDYLFLFFPAFTIAGLYWTRWWFLRPPRTWYDEVRSTLSATRPTATTRRL